MIELQVQLENVDHLRAKDTSLCRRLDLLRQLGRGSAPLPGDRSTWASGCIEGQVGSRPEPERVSRAGSWFSGCALAAVRQTRPAAASSSPGC